MTTAIQMTAEQRRHLIEDETAAIAVESEGTVVGYLVHGLRMQTDPAGVHALENKRKGVREPTRPAADVLDEMRRRFLDAPAAGGE